MYNLKKVSLPWIRRWWGTIKNRKSSKKLTCFFNKQIHVCWILNTVFRPLFSSTSNYSEENNTKKSFCSAFTEIEIKTKNISFFSSTMFSLLLMGLGTILRQSRSLLHFFFFGEIYLRSLICSISNFHIRKKWNNPFLKIFSIASRSSKKDF